MTDVFPLRRSSSTDPDTVRFVDPAQEADRDLLQSVSSSTACEILAAIRRDPRPASEIAAELDTSIQNVQYHLNKLEAADLVSPTDTWYSASGTEMDVYAPNHRAVVLLTGTRSSFGDLRELLPSALAAVLLVGVVSVIVERVTDNPFRRSYLGPIDVDPGMLAYLHPGLMFFAGGIFTLLVFVAARRLLERGKRNP